jgi:SPP1 family predicted phage head-tail adaptor
MKKEFINIGDFNEQIIWMQPVAAKDSFGQSKRTFTPFKTTWANVQPVSVGETEMSNRLQYAETYSFTTHFDSAINNTFQLTYNAEQYNISRIEKLNLSRFIRVTASKIVE